MHQVFFSTGLLAAAFLAHLAVWRIRVPQRAVIWLLVIWFGTGLAGWGAVLSLAGLRELAPRDPWEIFSAVLAHVAVSLAYLVTYSGLDQDSPSLTMAKFTDMAAGRGRAREEFLRVVTDELIVASRLQALLESGWVTREAGRYRLTPRGVFWNAVFSSWRRLLGLPGGG